MARTKKSQQKTGERMIMPAGETDDSFFEQVYSIIRQIPKCRVTTYGVIARCLGTKLSAQMVGWAMKHATGIKPKVPTHRVVNRVGLLSAKHHYGTNRMQTLLEKEGVSIQMIQWLILKDCFGIL